MSDWIEHDGRKYFEESYLLASSESAKRRLEKIVALEAERDNWRQTAEQESRNRDYYRGLLVQIGELFGVAARTQDDGGVAKDVLVAKVPELCAQLSTALREAREALAAIIDDTCSYICPSVGKVGTPIPHSDRCVNAQAVLARHAGLMVKEASRG